MPSHISAAAGLHNVPVSFIAYGGCTGKVNLSVLLDSHSFTKYSPYRSDRSYSRRQTCIVHKDSTIAACYAPNKSISAAPFVQDTGAERDESTDFATSLAVREPETAPASERKLKRSRSWPRKKAEFYVLRSDGLTCSRETIQPCGCLSWRHTSTQQELLVWKTPPRCVLVLKKLDTALDFQLDQVVAYLGCEEKLTVVVEAHEYKRMKAAYGWTFLESFEDDEKPQLHQVVDFVVCLGGDGVILHACTLFHSYVPPIIGFNLGSMGFLTNHEFSNFREDLRGVLHGCDTLEQCSTDDADQGGVHVTLRMRLLCEIYRRGSSMPSEVHEVLNEVVVDRGSSPFLSKIECYERGRLITRVQADGVLLATPTGSTAYSVAAGGSMAHPTLPAILFTPICPHSLSFRPVILPDYADLTLRIPDDARSSAWVCFDGKRRQELLHGDSVRVRMSPNPVPTINREDQTTDWFGSLQRCFNWSDRVEQKPLPAAHSVEVKQALLRQYSNAQPNGSNGSPVNGSHGESLPGTSPIRAINGAGMAEPPMYDDANQRPVVAETGQAAFASTALQTTGLTVSNANGNGRNGSAIADARALVGGTDTDESFTTDTNALYVMASNGTSSKVHTAASQWVAASLSTVDASLDDDDSCNVSSSDLRLPEATCDVVMREP